MSGEIVKRVRIARNAVQAVRKMDSDIYQVTFVRKDGTSSFYDNGGTEQKYPLIAYGALGLLDFIEFGDVDRKSVV